jgi:hypothetical protein
MNRNKVKNKLKLYFHWTTPKIFPNFNIKIFFYMQWQNKIPQQIKKSKKTEFHCKISLKTWFSGPLMRRCRFPSFCVHFRYFEVGIAKRTLVRLFQPSPKAVRVEIVLKSGFRITLTENSGKMERNRLFLVEKNFMKKIKFVAKSLILSKSSNFLSKSLTILKK